MEVIHDTPENPDVDPVCAECGNPLSDPADLEEGMHFLCDPSLILDIEEGGESG